MRRVVLVGGGHAHLFVLRRLAQLRRRDIEVTLVTPSRWQPYSGMLPGWMAGHYRIEDCRIDLLPLAEAAGARLLAQPIVGMRAARRCVCPADGRHVDYDLLSLDVGGETDCAWLAGLGARLIVVKPLAEFQLAWQGVLEEAKARPGFHLLVVGGGAAGVELSLAARRALQRAAVGSRVTLATGESGLLPEHAAGARRELARVLADAGVTVVPERAVGTADGVLLSGGQHLAADRVIAATGARAPVWLQLSQLQLDAEGYVTVDSFQRSRSHPEVFAAGDVCSRGDGAMPRSGVHAVRAGPVLAHNLLAALDDRPLRPHRPRRRALYLLASGDRRAVASWGRWSAEGAWLWRWKDAIDRGFIERFSVAA